MIDRYAITLRSLAVEGGGQLAEMPELPGCLSDGDDFWQAISNAMAARHETVRSILARPEDAA